MTVGPGGRAQGAPDEGSGTVLVVGLVAVALVLAAAAGTLGGAYVTRGRAQAAADLAALAAAGLLAPPAGVDVAPEAIRAADPCAVALDAAERNGARLTSCVAAADGVVAVTVTTDRTPGPFGMAATARARAGPSSARDR